MHTRHLTICRFELEESTNRAKRLHFPKIRGTWLPCFDIQGDGGIAINWLGVRIRASKRRAVNLNLSNG